MSRRDPAAPILVFTFHGIGPIPDAIEPAERRYWCPEKVFKELLDEVIPASQELGVSIRLTFDDGNDSDVRVALPALVKRGLEGQFFVCAGRIGESGYVGEQALLDLDSAGMMIGSHGWGHVDWRRADEPTLRRELKDSPKRLSDLLGRSVDEVAIPFGSYDRRVLHRLKDCNVGVVYTCDDGLANDRTWLRPRAGWTVGVGPPNCAH